MAMGQRRTGMEMAGYFSDEEPQELRNKRRQKSTARDGSSTPQERRCVEMQGSEQSTAQLARGCQHRVRNSRALRFQDGHWLENVRSDGSVQASHWVFSGVSPT